MRKIYFFLFILLIERECHSNQFSLTVGCHRQKQILTFPIRLTHAHDLRKVLVFTHENNKI